MTWRGIACVALVVLCAAGAWAAGSKQTSVQTAMKPVAAKSHAVPLLTEGLHLSDFADMKPSAELAAKLLHVEGFIQNQPVDGKTATQATEVWMGYSKSTLYVVFICHDEHPELIRGHLARRENIFKDDRVTILLDPFHDHRTGVSFTVNPVGVQADGSWSENDGSDTSYDQVWDSEAQVTKSGWIALMAIPFRSLRFPAAGGDWGVVFWRSLPRNSEADYWPRVSNDVSGILSQEALLSGIQGVTGSHNVQINPYTLGNNERSLNLIDPVHPYFSSRHAEGTGGGEMKAILKDKLVIDATINPDFSDVESDQPQFTVNQRYRVYYEELRPFFLENASYFSTPITLVYTRNIIHPEFGGRVTGKLGHLNLGLFAIDDRAPGETVTAADALYRHRARVAVGRLNYDLGKDSAVGLIYTDRELAGGWNRIGAVDFKARMGKHWTAQGQQAVSSTGGSVGGGNPPSYAAGPANYLGVQRSGNAFNFNAYWQDTSTGFATQLGFISTSNMRQSGTHGTYQWFPKHSRIQSWGLETGQSVAFDHQGNRIFRYMSFDPFWKLPRNTVIAPLAGQNSDTVGPQNGYALASNRNLTENFGGFVFRSAPFAQFSCNLQVFRSGNVNYNPPTGQTPFKMTQDQVQAYTTVQPVHQLTFDNVYLLDRNHAVKGGELVFEMQTLRTKVNYQFTRALSARVIVEYDSTLANPQLTSLKRTKQLGTQALFTWLPHPGTAVYVGYNNDLQNIHRSLCNRLSTGACDVSDTSIPRGDSMLNDGRQIFVKASYLIRF